MDIELIGTGAIYSKYNNACTLINEDMIVDVPNGVLKQLLNLNCIPEKIDKILITHMHGDHIADITFLLMYMYKAKEINRKTSIIGPIGIKNKVEQLFEVYDYHLLSKISEYIKFIELSPNEIIEDSEINYKIQAVSVLHGNEKPAYGYIVNENLGITGDTSLCEGVEYIMQNSKIIIADCSRINGDISHMGIDNLKYLTEKYKKQIFTTHVKDETREELIKLEISNISVEDDGFKIYNL